MRLRSLELSFASPTHGGFIRNSTGQAALRDKMFDIFDGRPKRSPNKCIREQIWPFHLQKFSIIWALGGVYKISILGRSVLKKKIVEDFYHTWTCHMTEITWRNFLLWPYRVWLCSVQWFRWTLWTLDGLIFRFCWPTGFGGDVWKCWQKYTYKCIRNNVWSVWKTVKGHSRVI